MASRPMIAVCEREEVWRVRLTRFLAHRHRIVPIAELASWRAEARPVAWLAVELTIDVAAEIACELNYLRLDAVAPRVVLLGGNQCVAWGWQLRAMGAAAWIRSPLELAMFVPLFDRHEAHPALASDPLTTDDIARHLPEGWDL
ncbi:MAG: hypothetical protein R3E01_27575 [Pirellulaceae bacterium]|nr:hypothetical protein [Planctomycetales bacterium]